MTPTLYNKTPLIRSDVLSKILGCSAYLKLENLQPGRSFKSRGLSFFVQRAVEKYGSSLHCIIASGGNAGIATACAANALGVRCTVYIPFGVADRTVEFLKDQGAEVIIGGKHYAEALHAAEAAVEREDNAILIPAYDDPTVWEGHASMIDEISAELKEKPDAIFCSVGGGGLLGGIIVGCQRNGWEDVPIVTLETIGSNCFHYSLTLNQSGLQDPLPDCVNVVNDPETGLKLAHFDSFHSKASGSLGASQPAARVLKMALERKGGVKSASVPDELSMHAAAAFSDSHQILVELACATTLAAGYNRDVFDQFVHGKKVTVVFIVCGGFKVTLNEMVEYAQIRDLGLHLGKVKYNL